MRGRDVREDGGRERGRVICRMVNSGLGEWREDQRRGLGVPESRGRWADGGVSGGSDGVSGGAAEAQRSPRHAEAWIRSVGRDSRGFPISCFVSGGRRTVLAFVLFYPFLLFFVHEYFLSFWSAAVLPRLFSWIDVRIYSPYSTLRDISIFFCHFAFMCDGILIFLYATFLCYFLFIRKCSIGLLSDLCFQEEVSWYSSIFCLYMCILRAQGEESWISYCHSNKLVRVSRHSSTEHSSPLEWLSVRLVHDGMDSSYGAPPRPNIFLCIVTVQGGWLKAEIITARIILLQEKKQYFR